MASINQYADNLLIDFADAAHVEVQRILRQHFGADWLARGVRKHFPPEQFLRVERMLGNPMRVVEMNKTAADLHGLEHFWNIINGNWSLFHASFSDKTRTEVYFGEIAELRNNLAHRRGHHTLLRGTPHTDPRQLSSSLVRFGLPEGPRIHRGRRLLELRRRPLGPPSRRAPSAER